MILIVAASLVTRAEEYGFDVWTTANGLPQNTVTGMVHRLYRCDLVFHLPDARAKTADQIAG